MYNEKEALYGIQSQAALGNVRFTQHAYQEMTDEDITAGEIVQAISTDQVLENYPDHRRGACCLLYGMTQTGRNLHIVCTAAQPEQPVLVVITVYVPQLPKWVTPTKRR